MDRKLKIAVSKGRILNETLPLLAAMGIEPIDDIKKSRKLIFPTTSNDIDIVIIRATDVPTYVQYGCTDFGVAGKDVLIEHGGEDIYEPLDLKIAICRLMVAGPVGSGSLESLRLNRRRIIVATKFVKSAKRFFAKQGIQVEVIKLYGSMELAPVLGLSDRIVDVVDTGKTLKANHLEAMEHIADISSRLIVSKASMKTKNKSVKDFIAKMSAVVSAKVCLKN